MKYISVRITFELTAPNIKLFDFKVFSKFSIPNIRQFKTRHNIMVSGLPNFFRSLTSGPLIFRLKNSKICIEMLQQLESFGLNYHEIIYFLSHSQQLFMLWIIFTYVLFSQVDCLQDVWPALFLTFLLFSDLFFLFYISKKVLTKRLSGMKYLAKICTSRCCYLYG